MSKCTDLTRNSIFLEDIENEKTGRFPGIRETELLVIAGPDGTPLKPVMTSFKGSDNEIHCGYVFPVTENMTIIQAQPHKDSIVIMIKQVQNVIGPKSEGNAWAATLKPLHITDDISTIDKSFLPAVNATLKKIKKPNPYNSFPAYALKSKPKKTEGGDIYLHCKRCKGGHSWIPRRFNPDGTPVLPKTCPKCKSPYWNKPRQKKK